MKFAVIVRRMKHTQMPKEQSGTRTKTTKYFYLKKNILPRRRDDTFSMTMGCRMSPIEFRPTGEPILIDDTYRLIDCSKRVGRRLYSNGCHAVEVVVGKKREQFLEAYNRQHVKPQPRTEVIVPEVKAPIVEEVEPIAEIATPPPVIDEQAEAEEFIEAVDYQELYPVQPDAWYEARIDKASRNTRGILILRLENATATCIPKVISKAPGEHRMCLSTYLPNAVAAVRLEIVNGKYRCLEMQVDDAPISLCETAKVISWDPMKSFGRAERPCGCRITIIGAFDEEVYGFVEAGNWIQFELEKSRNRGNWIGVRARKIEAPSGQGDK
jgi:hypothetical protein